jgi:hypothetical protein
MPTNKDKLPQRVIDELSRSGPLKGRVLAQRLRVTLQRVQNAVCTVNHSKKRDVMIIRIGRWGDCGYQIADDDARNDDLKDNIDSDDSRAIRHIKKRSKLYKIGKQTRSAQELEVYMNSVLTASMETLHELQNEFRTSKKI